MSQANLPDYKRLHKSGELAKRAETGVGMLGACRVCPHLCGVDRLADETKICGTGRLARVSSYFAHYGEEECLRGSAGSGTIFFSQCNLHCVFCQNFDISHSNTGIEVEPEHLAKMMLELQLIGCHNINFVTPTHVAPQILEALNCAIADGLRLPIVYNTGGYDSVETLKLFDGIVDIYMPDFKVFTKEAASLYLETPDYPDVARAAVKEMHRQVGDLSLDDTGVARRGVLVRHLVMPDQLEETGEIMRFLASELSVETFVNIMDQYHPDGRIDPTHHSAINRRATAREVAQAYNLAREAGLHCFDTPYP